MSLAMAVTACASDYLSVEVTDSEGKTTVLLLEDKPVARYADGELLISSSNTTLSFPKDETVEVVFKGDNVSVNEIKVSDTVALVMLPESIRILNLQPGSSTFLFSLSGDVIAECQADEEGNAILSLSTSGIYVIKTDTKTFKIVKK